VRNGNLEKPLLSEQADSQESVPDVRQDEVERIHLAYQRRNRASGPDRYSIFQADALYGLQERERQVIRALKASGIDHLSAQKVLDVGCGFGYGLRQFIQWGAQPVNLFGIDLLPERIAVARQLCPSQVTLLEGNGDKLPWNDNTFDIVAQSTVFTSILDADMKRRLAQEMMRVLKPNGIVLWFDFRLNNPRNPDVRGIGKREVRRLFHGCSVQFWTMMFLPPLARVVAPWSLLLVEFLGKLPLLCSHYVAVVRKPLP